MHKLINLESTESKQVRYWFTIFRAVLSGYSDYSQQSLMAIDDCRGFHWEPRQRSMARQLQTSASCHLEALLQEVNEWQMNPISTQFCFSFSLFVLHLCPLHPTLYTHIGINKCLCIAVFQPIDQNQWVCMLKLRELRQLLTVDANVFAKEKFEWTMRPVWPGWSDISELLMTEPLPAIRG